MKRLNKKIKPVNKPINKLRQINKQGQIESIGLVLIVLLIVLALIFTLPLLISNPDIQSLNEQYSQLKADSALSTLLSTRLSTKPESCQLTIKQELENCQLENKPACFESCQALKLEIQKILDNTFQKSQEYELVINSKPFISSKTAQCNNQISSTKHFLAETTPIAIVICA